MALQVSGLIVYSEYSEILSIYCPIWLNDKIQTLRSENNKEVLLTWKVLAYKNPLGDN